VEEHHPPQEETLAPDEPPTPLWLPMLGAALFLAAAIFVFAIQ
jgi:hypothetical protein